MSTEIEWCDETWNPVTGCTKVSPGCDHCYAERVTERFGGKGSFANVVLHPERLDKPLKWRKPRKVFVNSMSDLFHEQVPDEFIARVFAVMACAPEHTFQILTKRHGRMRSLLSGDFRVQVAEEVTELIAGGARLRGAPVDLYPQRAGDGGNLWGPDHWPLRNVWLGVSVEDQKWADIRIPALLKTPAAVRFLSCEPLLGPINLAQSLGRWEPPADHESWIVTDLPVGHRGVERLMASDVLHWVIVGGESGSGCRPMNPEWARSLRDQCAKAEIPFLFKQWGGRTPKAGGRLLDGRTWDEYPEAVDV